MSSSTEEVAYTKLPQEEEQPWQRTASSGSCRGMSFFTVFLLIALLVNIGLICFLQFTMLRHKEKIHAFRDATMTCAGKSPEYKHTSLDDLIAAEASTFIKRRDSPAMKAMMRWARDSIEQGIKKVLLAGVGELKEGRKMWQKEAGANQTSHKVPFLPLNMFEVLNEVITSNFTNLLETSSQFATNFSQGLLTINPEHFGSAYDVITIAANIMRIIAANVQPLTGNALTADNSVIGNIITQTPITLFDSTSDVTQYRKTAADCVVLMMRFYMTNFDTSFVKHDMEGHKHNGYLSGGNPLIFGIVRDYCDALYIGSS